jgi:predicted nuclease of predicted toxin-antitoxin system
MRAILSDHDIEGHFELLVKVLTSPELREVWDWLDLEAWRLRDVGLTEHSPDREIWEWCQREECVLITGNRNKENEESLEQTLRDSVTRTSLPVLTIGNLDRFRTEAQYREAVAWRLLDYLLDIDRYCGTGRQFLP